MEINFREEATADGSGLVPKLCPTHVPRGL